MREEFPVLEVVGFFVMAFILWALSLPIISEAAHAGWNCAVKDFQTLIAGVLAVVAAAITIYAMAVIETRAASRFETQQKAALRPQALVVDRLLHLISGTLHDCQIKLKKTHDELASHKAIVLSAPEVYYEARDELLYPIAMFISVFNSAAWVEATPLMDAKLMDSYRWLMTFAGVIERSIEEPAATDPKIVLMQMNRLESEVASLEEYLAGTLEGLAKLAEEFGVPFPKKGA